jgi:DNA-binding GntR family transcriptional regulator
MEGRFWPGHRFKIRELATTLNVSETPVREALMQLVRERALDMRAGRSISVAHLSLAQYIELRTIRLFLEGLAAENATARITDAEIDHLEGIHEGLIDAEKNQRWSEAVKANWQFHHTLYAAAELPELLAILESIWLRNGPLLNFQYPHAPPTYKGRHQHLVVLESLRRRSPQHVSQAVRDDMIEGGAGLVKLLEQAEAGTRPLSRERSMEP